MSTIRLLLADDHTLLRARLRMLLAAEPGFEVVGESASGEEAVALAAGLSPDVVLMDLSMPGIGGLEAIRRIAATGSGTRVLALTVHAGSEYLMPESDPVHRLSPRGGGPHPHGGGVPLDRDRHAARPQPQDGGDVPRAADGQAPDAPP